MNSAASGMVTAVTPVTAIFVLLWIAASKGTRLHAIARIANPFAATSFTG
ncbi:MAG: hypothetical protein K8F25_18150 [Fimbriimonadaceae bacterium]|nr:hypothetical protein [Alphaproteobacteria bacterium]